MSVKQMHAYSMIMMTHKILVSGVPRGIRETLDTNFVYRTRRAVQGQLRYADNVRGRRRTKLTA